MVNVSFSLLQISNLFLNLLKTHFVMSVLAYRYGVILEKFQQMDYTLRERIKGCIIDSAPVASPDPQVNSDTNH